jgi:hypothetical protein
MAHGVALVCCVCQDRHMTNNTKPLSLEKTPIAPVSIYQATTHVLMHTFGHHGFTARQAVRHYASAIEVGHTQEMALEVMQQHSGIHPNRFRGALERAAA